MHKIAYNIRYIDSLVIQLKNAVLFKGYEIHLRVQVVCINKLENTLDDYLGKKVYL
jgi:hypothetical protein